MTNSDTDAGPKPTRRAIVATHGDLAAALVAAVEQITGRGDVLVPFTNRNLGGDEIERRLREVADEHGAQVLFTDMLGGSCALGARRLIRERPDLVLVTGANLSTLLDFVFGEELSPREAALHAADKGRASITVSAAPVEVRGAD